MTNFVEITQGEEEDENSPRVRNNLRRSLQYGAAVDLLAHGEIHGLVGGLGGVYFNGTPLVDTEANIRSESLLYKAYNSAGSLYSFTPVISNIWNGRTFGGRNFVIRRGLGPFTTTSAASAGSNLLPTTEWDGNSVSTALKSIVGMTNVAGSNGIPINVWIYNNSSPAEIIDVVRVEQMPGTAFSLQGAIRLVTGLRVDIPSNSTFYIDAAAKSGSGTVGTSLSPIVESSLIPMRTFTSSSPAIIQAFHVQSGGVHGDQKSKAFPDSFVDFKKGRQVQAGTVSQKSAPTASFIYSPSLGPQGIYNGIPLITNNSYSSYYDPEAAQTIASSDFTFTQYSATEIDSLDVDIEFPGGLWAIDDEVHHARVFVEFQIIFKYKTEAGGNFKTKLMYGKDYGKDTDTNIDYVSKLDVSNGSHRWLHDWEDKNKFPNDLLRKRASNGIIYGRAQKTPFIERFTLDITGLQPFTEWAIEVRRLVPGEFAKFWSADEAYGGACASKIKAVTANIHEKFSYPMSAYAITGFSAQDFPSPPKRAYKIKGKKIRVPTNYFVRDESSNNTAGYTRNVATGQSELSYQTWDGNFRGDESLEIHLVNASKVYCNNPAWVFYDILTNKEFGLGEFIQESDIDKYSLYQIARYCDELVPDGKGGEEPRFTCNVYLQKEVEAYKVLKDLSSTFRAMMYWIDGQITAVQDRPKEPVYTFTTGNVKDGLFSYTYTGSRARTNQVRVSYNEPLEFYKQTIISVDDVVEIAKQGKIIPKDVVAFGCTSESQARRVGKWHLETDIKETEIVTFSTSLNAGFLSPGDIINVQDKRAEDSVVSSGRIISGSTSTFIKLDRTVTFPGGKQGKDCNIYIIYPKPGVYLQQETATINSNTYKRGELIQADSTGSDLLTGATSEKAANLKDDSGNPVTVSFSPHSRVEVEAIADSHTGTTANEIATTGAFAGGAPSADAIWAISREEPVSSAELKKYRIVGIREAAINEFEITASQYIIEKFDEIDIERPVNTSSFIDVATRGATIPTPSSIIGAMELGRDGNSYDAVITWSTPIHTETDSNGTTAEMPYRYLSGFELRHGLGSAQTDVTNFASVEGMVGQDAITLDANRRSFRVTGITPGRYVVSLATLNDLGHKSRPLVRAIDFNPRGGDLGNRVAAIQSCTAIDGSVTHSGGIMTISPSLALFIKNKVHTITSSGSSNVFDFQNMDENSTAYLYFDASGPSVKMVYLQTDSESNNNYAYLKENHANKGLTLHTNSSGTTATVVVEDGDTIIGTNSAFTSDFAVGDLIKFSTDVDPEEQDADSEYRIVAPGGDQGVSDSKLRVDETIFDRTDNSSSTDGMLGGGTIYAFKQAFKPDFDNDAIVAKIERGSGSSYTFTPVANPVFANATRNENKGVYSSSTAYSKNDIVTFQGRSYMALVDTTAGQAPSGSDTDNDQWSLLAAQGGPGDPGNPGPSGGDGRSIEVVYYASRHLPTTPGNSTIPPSGGWSTNVPTAIENIWMSTGRQTVDGDGNPTSTYQWGTPQKLTDVSTNILATLGHLPWTVGTGSQGSDTNTKWDAFGTASESVREEDLGPFGASSILWKAKDADNTTSGDGGFQSPRTAPITHDQTYRFSVFVKTTSDSGLTRFANIGYQTDLSAVETFTSVPGSTSSPSPLFCGRDLPANNKWYLLVGFVNASGSSYSALNVDSGIWSPETGAKVTSEGFTDWKMTGNTAHLGLMAYRHGSEGGETHFISPRIDIADDRMPSIADLLRTGAAGEGKEFVYAGTNYETAIETSKLPSNGWGFDVGGTSDDLQWLDAAPSLSAALPYLWECTRKVVGVPAEGAVVEGEWDTPRVIGRYGEDPRTVRLEASDYSVVYNTDGASPQYTKLGSNLRLTATAQGYDTPHYKFSVDGNQVQGFGESNTYNWPEGSNANNELPTSIGNTTSSVLKVEVKEAGSNNADSSDSLSILLLKTAAKGDEGDAAHAGVLTNQSHTLPTDEDGEYAESILGNAGGTFEYYIGATKQTSGITYGHSGDQTSNGLSININSSTGVYSLSGGSWAGDSATFTLIGTHSEGTVITLSYSIAKAKKGEPGTAAINKKQVTIFQLVANKGDAPAPPSGGNYTTPISILMVAEGWLAEVPSLNSDGDNVYSSTRIFTAGDSEEGAWTAPTLSFTRRDGVTGAAALPAASYLITYDDLETAAPDANGEWAFENSSNNFSTSFYELRSASYIYIHTTDSGNTDQSSYLSQLEVGDIFTLSFNDSPPVWASFKVTDKSLSSSRYKFEVENLGYNDEGLNNDSLSDADNQPVSFRFSRAAEGIGATTTVIVYLYKNAEVAPTYSAGNSSGMEGTLVYNFAENSISTKTASDSLNDWATVPAALTAGLTTYYISAVASAPAIGTTPATTVDMAATAFNALGIKAGSRSGSDAYSVSLTANKYAVSYTGTTATGDDFAFTAEPQGILGTATYKFEVKSGSGEFEQKSPTSGETQTAATYAMLEADEPAAGAAKVVKVTLFDDGESVATDSVSIYGVRDGTDAITVVLTNSAHVFPTSLDTGEVDYSGGGTDIKVYKGNTALAYGAGSDQFEVETPDASGISAGTPSTPALTTIRRFSAPTDMEGSTASITYTIKINNYSGFSSALEVTKVQTFSKTVGIKTISLYKLNDNDLTSTKFGTFATPLATVTISGTSHAAEAGWSGTIPNLESDNDKVYVTSRTFTSDGEPPQDDDWKAPVVYSQRTDGAAAAPSASYFITYDDLETAAPDANGEWAFKNSSNNFSTSFSELRSASYIYIHTTDSGSTDQSSYLSQLEVGDIFALSFNDSPPVWASFKVTDKSLSSSRYEFEVENLGYNDEGLESDSLSGAAPLPVSFRFSRAAEGAEGAASVDLSISSSSNIFNFDDSNDTSPTPATVTITATQSNQASALADTDLSVTKGAKAGFSYSGSDGTGSATWVVTPSDYPVTCVVTNDGLTETVIITKTVGGLDGAAAYDIEFQSNAVALPASSTGAVSSFSGSGQVIKVSKAGTALTAVTTETVSTGQFKVAASASGITVGSKTASSQTMTFAAASAMTAETATITFTINCEGSTSIVKKQEFTKVKDGAGFLPDSIWTFSNDDQGWTPHAAWLTHQGTAKTVLLNGNNDDPQMYINDLSINGSAQYIVRARIMRDAGSGWDGILFYDTSGPSGHGDSASHQKTISDTTVTDEWKILEWDMSNLTAGGNDWITNTITGLRFDFGLTNADSYYIDWLAVGKHDLGLGGTVGAVEGVTTFDSSGDLITSIDNAGVVTSSIASGDTDHSWFYNSSAEYNPNSQTQTVVIDWRDGTNTLKAQCTIESTLDVDDQNINVVRTSNSGPVTFGYSGNGSPSNDGRTDVGSGITTCTYSGIAVQVNHHFASIDSWSFKQG